MIVMKYKMTKTNEKKIIGNAWAEYDKGKFVKKSKEDFLKELEEC